jgi:hypothetical protein
MSSDTRDDGVKGFVHWLSTALEPVVDVGVIVLQEICIALASLFTELLITRAQERNQKQFQFQQPTPAAPIEPISGYVAAFTIHGLDTTDNVANMHPLRNH